MNAKMCRHVFYNETQYVFNNCHSKELEHARVFDSFPDHCFSENLLQAELALGHFTASKIVHLLDELNILRS
jgi:hypothetical protein